METYNHPVSLGVTTITKGPVRTKPAQGLCPLLAFMSTFTDKSVSPLFNIPHTQIRFSPAFPYRSSSAEGTRFPLPHPLLPPCAGGLRLCASALHTALIFWFPQLCNRREKCDFLPWCRVRTAHDRGVGIKAEPTNCSLDS